MAKAVGFTRDAASRIVQAVRTVEGIPKTGAGWHPYRADDAGIVLGKTTAAWSKGTTATIEVYNKGTLGSELRDTPIKTLTGCINKFGDIATGRWVMLASLNGGWYVISAEC